MRVLSRHVVAAVGCLLITAVAWARSDAPGLPDPRASAAVDAVVQIETVALPDARSNATLGRERSGSGVVIDGRGYVLTIGYLVMEAETIAVKTSHDRTVPGVFAAYDHATGFALVKLLAPIDVKPIAFGDSGAVKEHDVVMALPFGGRDAAQVARVVSKRQFAGSWEYLLDEAIFTSPPTQQWAGAALISADFKLIGLGSLLVRDAMGTGEWRTGNLFVPIDILKPILADMISSGKRKGPARPWLGIGTEEAHGLLVITRISPDGPAASAGLEPGDVVVGVSSASVHTQAELYRKVWDLGGAGVKVPLRVRRGAAVREVVVNSIERSAYFRDPVRQ